MARRKSDFSEEKQNIISALLQKYDIQSADDIQDALKDLLGRTIQSMMEAEMDYHLGYEPYERTSSSNARNGKKPKSIRSKYGEMSIRVPQGRESSFEPQVVQKRQKDISHIDDKIIAMYAKGLYTRQISEQIEDIYGFDVSEGMISDVTNKLLPENEDWQHRPLSRIYPVVFIDAVHFSVRDNNVIKKLAAYVILGINEDGLKEVIGLQIGQNESSKYWLGVLNELKKRGVQDILILCADGLSGMKEAVNTAFPTTEYNAVLFTKFATHSNM
jgi:putative transposase